MSASSADSRATENPRPWERSAAAQVAAELATGLPDTEIRLDEPFSLHTSFRIGGPADLMLLPRSVEDLQTIVRTAWERSYPLVVVGNGSNLLVRDGGVRGLVLKVAENLSRTRFDGVEGYAQSGALLAAVSKEAAAHSLSSLEVALHGCQAAARRPVIGEELNVAPSMSHLLEGRTPAIEALGSEVLGPPIGRMRVRADLHGVLAEAPGRLVVVVRRQTPDRRHDIAGQGHGEGVRLVLTLGHTPG